MLPVLVIALCGKVYVETTICSDELRHEIAGHRHVLPSFRDARLAHVGTCDPVQDDQRPDTIELVMPGE